MSEPSGPPASPHARVEIDLSAIRGNVRRLRKLVAEGFETGSGGSETGLDGPPQPPAVMAVVKADAYGHGMVPVARAAREGGAAWLGVATGEEALALREAGDTGLSRNGASRGDWLELVTAARIAQDEGAVKVTGLWSHLACADEPAHPANRSQQEAFTEACALAVDAGLEPEVRHLANSAGALLIPSTRHDLVRLGISAYGFSPAPDVVSGRDLGLVPAMTVWATVVLAKDLQPGDGVSYGHTFVATEPMRVALVPLGYGDGVPRHASSKAEVQIDGVRGAVLGRICMDQFVVAAPEAHAGDEAVLFGPGTVGEPTATDWARWCDTIDYEIVTRMGGRQTRIWVDPEAGS